MPRLISFAEKVKMPKQLSVSLRFYCSGNARQDEESERHSEWRCDKPTKDPKSMAHIVHKDEASNALLLCIPLPLLRPHRSFPYPNIKRLLHCI